jgi:phosphoribosyl-AMP cyclohydrolase
MIDLDFDKSGGLIPVIAQDAETSEVLMLAYINREAWEKTLSEGFAHYFSRSRNKIWKKGETSGHLQEIVEIRVDCDLDTVLYRVKQYGSSACHEGYISCFFRTVDNDSLMITGKKP